MGAAGRRARSSTLANGRLSEIGESRSARLRRQQAFRRLRERAFLAFRGSACCLACQGNSRYPVLRQNLGRGQITEGEWRAVFMEPSPMLAPKGFGGDPTPWRAVQDAAWRAVGRL